MPTALPRKIRLVTGMVLFAYVAGHLLNLALGLHSLELMDEWLPVFQAPWQNPVGVVALYGSLLLHMLFGLHALYARRTLRLTRFDAVQLALGLALPPLLVIHLLGTRAAFTLTGFLPSYAWLMLIYWQWLPLTGLRQVLVVMVTWMHGCMSLYYWLRLQPWWPSWRGFLYPLAFLVPVASLLGFVEAGKDALVLAGDEAWLAALRARAEVLDEATLAGLYRVESVFLWTYAAVVACVLLARAWRLRGAGDDVTVQVSYRDGPTVRAERGLSLLEVSRRAEVPHASLCGGRGRCGTCRVRVVDGASYLSDPSPLEAATLARLGAAGDVRLACQCVPRGSPLTLERLLPADSGTEALAPAAEGRREAVIVLAALEGVDALAAGRADHDTLFLVGRYLDVLARAVGAAGGRLERAGADGVRAVFGVDEPLEAGARHALGAVRAMTGGVAALAREQLDAGVPALELKVSVQAGRVLLGEVEVADALRPALAGPAVDLAVRAERELGGEGAGLLLAESVARLGGVRVQDLPAASIDVDGEPARVLLLRDAGELAFEPAGPVPT